MVRTKEVDVDKFLGNKAIVIIKKLTFGEMSDIRDAIPINVVGNMQTLKPQAGQIGLLFLQKAIVSAPFVEGIQPTMEEIRKIDTDLGDYLLEQVYELNGIPPNE